MRARSTRRGALTGQRREQAVRSGRLRAVGHLTGAMHATGRHGRSVLAKVETQGHLDPDQQLATEAAYRGRKVAARLLLPRAVRRSRAFNNIGRAAGLGRTSTVGAVQVGGQLDAEDATVRATRHGEWWTVKTTAKAGVAAGRLGVKGAVAGGRLTGRAVAGGARLTGRAARGTGRFARATAARTSVVAARLGNTAARAVAMAQAGARVAMLTIRAAAAALASAAGGTVVPAVVAAVAVVAVLMAILPGFITGASYQTQQEQALAACLPASTAGNSGGGYRLGPVKPHVQAAADLLGAMFGVADIGGWRAGDTYDYEGHPAGLALDVMVYGDRAKGQAIADYARAHAAELGIKYVIWYQQIWSVGRDAEGWRPMADRGSISANHHDHVHVSFNPTAGTGSPGDMLAAACGNTAAGIVGAGGWAAPVANLRAGSGYGMRRHPITGVYKLHTGDDYPGSCGNPIHAASNGVVTAVSPNLAYGMLVTIDHGQGIETRYAHMYSTGVLVRPGQRVTAGQQIARIGSNGYSTGCHLHFEVKVNGTFVHPSAFLAERGIK